MNNNFLPLPLNGDLNPAGPAPALDGNAQEEFSEIPEGRSVHFLSLLPAIALSGGICISLLYRADWNRLILPLEVFADLFIAFFAFRHKSAGAAWWRIAAVSLLAGDTFYLTGHLVQSFPKWAFMCQEACYTLSRFMTAGYLLVNLRLARKLETAEKTILAALAVIITFISVQYLVIPYFSSGNHDTLFFHVNAILNRLAESAVFPLALLLGMKARSRYWLYMTHGLTLLSISSIALGYYIAINAGTAGIPLQEYGWLCGLLIILGAQAYSSDGPAPFARWNSARVRLAWLVMIFNLALLLSLYVIQLFISKDAFQLTSILFIFFGLWLVANLIAFRISEDLHLLLGNIHTGTTAQTGPVAGTAIYEAELFAKKLKAAYSTIRSQERMAALSAMAAQVAHDIRSPLAALDSALGDVPQLPEEKRLLIRGAAGRIRDIANDLLEKNRQEAEPGKRPDRQPELRQLSSLIDPVITEKRLQYRDRRDIEIKSVSGPDSGTLFALIDAVEFGRVLSNLVNNSVEALERGGSVTVSLAAREGSVEIAIRDDGKGIPAGMLGRLGRRGETHGKTSGSGLGLYHARAAAESWNGSLEIYSEPGKGTEIKIQLPLSRAPANMAALLDDDELVLLNWRTAARSAGVDLRAYKDPAAFMAAAEDLPRNTPLYIDSELGSKVTGEELAGLLHGKGFPDITLSTGHPPEKFSAFPWLKVAGKEPPWPPA